jgi:hypothetical protein
MSFYSNIALSQYRYIAILLVKIARLTRALTMLFDITMFKLNSEVQRPGDPLRLICYWARLFLL